MIKKDDKAYIAINASQMQDTLSAFGHNEKISNKILIIGGGNIGFNLAKNLEETFDSARVKIIEKDKERAEQRKSLVSTGDRSAKIRTYNYPQGRITDHRIGKTIYNLSGFINGDMQEMLDALKMAENAEKLKEGVQTEG